MGNLWFYSAPSLFCQDGAGTLNAGEGFITDAKVSVNGLLQYKVHNSKGNTYYITANEVYVKWKNNKLGSSREKNLVCRTL